jgi:hypothetical protein
MIKINNGVPAFLVTGADTQTSTKTGLLTVNYQTSLSTKELLMGKYFLTASSNLSSPRISGVLPFLA